MRTRTNLRTAGACVAALCAVLFSTGCDLDPIHFLSRNACEFVNCDELFFIEDLLPLSARPDGEAASGSGMVMDTAEPGDEGGGHAH